MQNIKGLHHAPFLRILPPFLAGILLWPVLSLPVYTSMLWSALFVLCYLLARMYVKQEPISTRLSNAFIILFLLIAGLISRGLHDQSYSTLRQLPETFVDVQARVIRADKSGDKGIRLSISPLWIHVNGRRVHPGGTISLYINKGQNATLRPGHIIQARGLLGHIAPAANPHQFDYGVWLRKRGTMRQMYIDDGDWIHTGQTSPGLYAIAAHVQESLAGQFDRYGFSPGQSALLKAMLTGRRSSMDSDQKEAYARAGIVHILAISGLHVGIIYLFLFRLLFFLGHNKKTRLARTLIIIICLWAYALISGMSPSVMRAALMFSMLHIGIATGREHMPLNTLAASAFILLLFNPLLIYDAGFQFSYTAVAGILFFYPHISRWWQPSNYILRTTWQATAVSLAAQLATLPLGIFYFHRLPLYALFSNLLVLILVPVLIAAAIIYLLLAFSPMLQELFHHIPAWLGYMLNHSASAIANVPGAVFDDLQLYPAQLLMLYLLVAGLFYFSQRRNGLSLLFSLLMILGLQSSALFYDYTQARQSRLIVYHLPGHTAVDIIRGHKNMLIADKALLENKKAINYNIRENWLWSGIGSPSMAAFSETPLPQAWLLGNPLILQGGKSMLVLSNGNFEDYSSTQCYQTDYILLNQHSPIVLEPSLALLKPVLMIADGSAGYDQLKAWEAYACLHNLPIHITAEQGAFVAEMKKIN